MPKRSKGAISLVAKSEQAKGTEAKALPLALPANGISWAGVVMKGMGAEAPKEASVPTQKPSQTSAPKLQAVAEPLKPGGLGTCSCLCRGRLTSLFSTYAWIMPLDPIEHPDCDNHGGLIWVSFSDVRPGTPLIVGIELEFGLYADIDGLGADDCHVATNQSPESLAILNAAIQPWLQLHHTAFATSSPPLPRHTPLRAAQPRHTPLRAAKAFAPGAAGPQKGTIAARKHQQPPSLHVEESDKPGDEKAAVVECDSGSISPVSTGTGGESIASEKTGLRFPADELICNPLPGFLPPPGLPPPPGLEDCSPLKIEG